MNRFKTGGLLLMALSLMACGKVEETPEVRTFGQKLTLEQDRILGFEAPTGGDWSTNNGSAISLSSNSSKGSGALAIVPNGYTELSSVQVDAPGSAATQATFDLILPSVLAWGEARLIIKIPSQGQGWRDVGGIALAGRPAGVYQTLSFGIPSDLQAALNSSATDVSFMIVLNVASSSGQYLVDNLKVTVDPGPPGPAPDPDLITIQLPEGQDIADRQVVAAGFLELRDGARVVDNDSATPAGSPSDHVSMINLGAVSTHMSSGSQSGPLTSAASVWMGNNARVYGDLLTAGSLQMQAGAGATGTITQNGTLPGVTTRSWKQPIEADPARAEEILHVGETRSLAPGSYNELVAYSGATLNLSSGNYAFSSMQLEPHATLNVNIDPSVGPVVLYVEDVLAWRSTTTPLDAEGLILVYKGTQDIKFERPMGMALIAPHAKVTLATGGLPHFGSVYAQGISLDPQVVLTAVPFKYWDWVLPPGPYVSCVYPSGAGHYMAAFGYKNERDVPVQIPAGVNNRFVPDSAKGIAVLEGFAPGDHPESVWVDLAGEEITWEVHGQSATASRASPACDLAEMAIETPRVPEGRSPLRPSLPPTPAWSAHAHATRNLLGAGRQSLEAVPRFPWMVIAGLSGGGGVISDDPPDVAPGSRYFTDPVGPINLLVIAEPKNESIFSSEEAYLSAKLMGVTFAERKVVDSTAWCGLMGGPLFSAVCSSLSGVRVFSVVGPQEGIIEASFQFREKDNLSKDEYINGELVFLAPTFGGVTTLTSGTKNVDKDFDAITSNFGEMKSYEGHKGDKVKWSLELEPSPIGSRIHQDLRPLARILCG